MKRKILLPAIALMLAVTLAGCVGITDLGSEVFYGVDDVTSVLIRDEATGETTLITDKAQIEALVSQINDTLCLYYPDETEASDSDKEVRCIVSFNPSGSDISLEDNLLFVYSEKEFHYGGNHYMAVSSEVDFTFGEGEN